MAAAVKIVNGAAPDSNVIATAKLICKVSIAFFGYKKTDEIFKRLDEGLKDLTREVRKLRIVEEAKRDIQSLSLAVTQKTPAKAVDTRSWFETLKSVFGGSTKNKNNTISVIVVDKMVAKSIGMKIDYAVLSRNPIEMVFLCKILPKATNIDMLKLMEILGDEVGTGIKKQSSSP